MRTSRHVMLAVLIAVLAAPSWGAQQKEPSAQRRKGAGKEKVRATALFDGKSLAGWKGHLADPNVKTEEVWSVRDGVLVCKGEPLGYLYTEQAFQDFVLRLEWRWAPGKEPGNSGVLLRIAGDPIGFMPRCIEAQLKHGSAGDIWAFRGAHCEGPKDRRREVKGHETLGDFVGVARQKDAEKPAGEWNTYRIVFRGDRLSVFINGQRVNSARGCDVVAGPIGLQSEGAEIHFRNIKITPLK